MSQKVKTRKTENEKKGEEGREIERRNREMKSDSSLRDVTTNYDM